MWNLGRNGCWHFLKVCFINQGSVQSWDVLLPQTDWEYNSVFTHCSLSVRVSNINLSPISTCHMALGYDPVGLHHHHCHWQLTLAQQCAASLQIHVIATYNIKSWFSSLQLDEDLCRHFNKHCEKDTIKLYLMPMCTIKMFSKGTFRH